MTLGPTKDRYAATLTVRKYPFCEPYFISAYAPEKDEALRRCREAADKAGWKPPSRWQWWRRSDSKDPYVAPFF